MTADEFDEVTELAARAVEERCPIRTVWPRTGACTACVMAAARVRALEISDLPPAEDE